MQRSENTEPPGPPRPPAYTLIWMAVAALLVVLVIAVWRGWSESMGETRWMERQLQPQGCRGRRGTKHDEIKRPLLRGVLSLYFHYYHQTRTHLSLEKDCPDTAA